MDPVLEKREVVMSTSYNVDEYAVYGLEDFVGDIDRATQPAVEIYSPVLSDSGEMVAHEDRNDAELVGIMGISIFWRDLLEGILPVGNDGLVAVFSNACNQTFTFQVDGPEATYLGSGDLHDPHFDDLKVHSSLNDLRRFSSVHQLSTGAPLNREYCPYQLHLYSSHEMANQYLTSAPLAFAIIAVFICE